ncbi:MAG: HlyD family efflux transporter periplasmic adaptor subunit [Candidatus Omnitrophota bacterium]
MMKNKYKIAIVLFFVIVVASALIYSRKSVKQENGTPEIINPVQQDIAVTVSATGIVEPQNRLEIKPSIGGRIESILVNEGGLVKEGDILAWMSSTERAALIDAARSQGGEVLNYWQQVYKTTPIISPINGEVIVRAFEPGQTVTTSDAVLVLSDRLIISAQFDETDIGRVKLNQLSLITLDAYPDIKIEGVVSHIAYESEIVNNVTIYNVDILPKEVPEILRSGMSVSVDVVEKESTNVITIPSNAVHYDGERQFVLVEQGYKKPSERNITIGLSNEKTVEVLSGLTTQDNVIIYSNGYLPKRAAEKTSPFMPSRRR